MDRVTMKQRILIAEDNEDVRSLCTLILEMEGYEVATAVDGQAAYDELLRHPPDLLITDLSMPRMDGFALIKALRQEARVASIPIILFTAYGTGRLKNLKPLGVDLVLEKPIDPQELSAAVAAVLPT